MNAARPLCATALAKLAVTLGFMPWVIDTRRHVPAPLCSVTLSCVTLSPSTRAPAASVTSTWSVAVERLSAAIEVGLKLAAVFAAGPAAVLVRTALQPARPAADAETWMSPGVVVLVMVTVMTPAVGATAPSGLIVAYPGVTLTTLIAGA